MNSQLKNQRAQVPGYCGYIPGKRSQNKFGTTFGQVTQGAYQTQKDSFLTTNISNNAFIQQQHSHQHEFWSNQGKLDAFNKSNKQPIKHNKRQNAKKFIPTKITEMTYQEAIKKPIQ